MTAMREQMIVKKVRLAKYMAVADCAFMYNSVRATSTNAEQHVSCDDISPQLLYSRLVLTKDSTSSANLSALLPLRSLRLRKRRVIGSLIPHWT